MSIRSDIGGFYLLLCSIYIIRVSNRSYVISMRYIGI
jgi:hypothetical protein